MNAGRIEQLGAPREVYERPRTRFVAGFIGTSNLMTGMVKSLDGTTAVLETTADESIVVPDAVAAGATVGKPLDLTVRPEKIVLGSERPAAGRARCAAGSRRSSTSAPRRSTTCSPPTAPSCIVFVQNASDSRDLAERDDSVWLSWRPEHSLALASRSPTPEPAPAMAS